jgi:hypothetical protein
MSNRYYYDKDGNYKGCSSDKPPQDPMDAVVVVVGVLGAVALIHAALPWLVLGAAGWTVSKMCSK